MDYVLLKNEDMPVQEFEWGSLTWYASKELSNTVYTQGICKIKPGKQNTLHYHPDSSETIHVKKGKIIHSIGDKTIEMSQGDTITVFEKVIHNAANIGDEEAELFICFSKGERSTCSV